MVAASKRQQRGLACRGAAVLVAVPVVPICCTDRPGPQPDSSQGLPFRFVHPITARPDAPHIAVLVPACLAQDEPHAREYRWVHWQLYGMNDGWMLHINGRPAVFLFSSASMHACKHAFSAWSVGSAATHAPARPQCTHSSCAGPAMLAVLAQTCTGTGKQCLGPARRGMAGR